MCVLFKNGGRQNVLYDLSCADFCHIYAKENLTEYGNPVDPKMNTTTIAAFTKPCGFIREHSFGLNSSLWTDIRIISGRNTSGLAGKHLKLVCQNAIHCEAIAVEKQVAVALWRLCTRNLWRTVGLTFGTGCCRAMNIKGKTIQEFQNINRFPQVVGALDGLHIPINPLHPNINMLILYTLLPTFPKVLTMRIYLKIRSSFIW